MSAYFASVLTTAVMYFPRWHPALIKFGSWASELVACGGDRGISSTQGRIEPSPVGALVVAP
jgi:hypothetical protein